MLKIKVLSLIFIMAGFSEFVHAQSIVTYDNISADVLIQDSLISGCVTASNITTSQNAAFGAFTNQNTTFPFESGAILATGEIENAEASGSGSSDINGGSDPDLQLLLPDYTINDATVIEFDFVPASDTIRFDYIFGSDEFPEYVGTSYNDVFGFFISGPGINGPYTNNAQNIALLPNGDPVTIDNLYNTAWYVTESDFDNAVNYDGLSLNLTAEAIVQSCQTYHIKLAIGDAGDHILDSGVFIESGSFTSGVQINAINHSDVGTDSDLYEGCSNYFVLERAENSDEEEEVLIYITYAESSTAEEGVDVSEIVDSAYMAPYENYDTIHYTAFNDGIEEGTELMILEFWTECPCGGSGGNSVIDTIEIYDAESIKGGIQDVQTRYCGEEPPESLTLAAEVNINPAYYEWNTGSYSNQIVVNPSPGIETYSVTISDVCGNEVYDSVTIRVSDMNVVDIAEEQVTCYNNCDGGFEIIMEDDTENYQYTYGNADYFYLVDSLTTTTDPVVDGLCPNDYYIKIVDDIDCYIESEVTVPNKPNINLSPGIINSSVNFCEPPGEITLNAEASIDDATFQWFNGEMGPNTTVTPEHGENEYWVEISDLCGTTFTDYVTIRLSEITMDTIILPDTNECSGAIQLIPSGGFEPYNVYWEEPLEDFGLEIEDLCAGDYIFELTDDIGCEYTDTLSVPLSNSIADESAYPVVVYPNPAKNHAFIDLSELPGTASIVNIYSLTGQLINSKRTSDPVYRTPELPAGSYTIEIMTPENKRRYIDKLIITE